MLQTAREFLFEGFGALLGARFVSGSPHRLDPQGLAFVDETDDNLVATNVNLPQTATDINDRTSAITLAGKVRVHSQVSEKVVVYGQLELRYDTGMSEEDELDATGL